jgi:nicotinic acid phosphoribosyltransferase
MRAAGISPRTIVFEDEVSPDAVRRVYAHFKEATGQEPTLLFPGAGGYWWRLVHRDTLAAAFKRSATGDHPNVKFSNSPGKESLGGYLRVHGRGETMVVADASEAPQGEPLFVKLVEQGRIVYRESFQEQAARADRTWGKYKWRELSPKVAETMRRFEEMRRLEVAAARERLAKG